LIIKAERCLQLAPLPENSYLIFLLKQKDCCKNIHKPKCRY
jgi:hypothetical protein